MRETWRAGPLPASLAALLALCFAQPPVVYAKPVAPAEFCRIYPDVPACASGRAACTTCHTAPPARNVFGAQVEQGLLPGAPRPLSNETYLSGLPAALSAAEALDADGDGSTNLEELRAGTLPTDAASTPEQTADCEPEARERAAAQGWNTCAYDPAYALKRVSLDFCGVPPARAELESIRQSADWQALLQQKLALCLDSAFWRGKDGVLWNLANSKVLPESSLKSGEDAGDIGIADYWDDYNLFIYINTDDRDVRELLTAQYFVLPDQNGNLVSVERTPIEDIEARSFEVAQLVPPNRRAGMLTTRWFLVKNTMFTPLPRTTAAQAYRAYLGYDIANMEGLRPVAGEPLDLDRKGVQAEQCAVCHTTLDPSSYPFSRYDGLGGGDEEPFSDPAAVIGPDGTVTLPVANYVPTRLERFVRQEGPQIAQIPEAGVLFGQPVADLLELARVAAQSDDFARKVVLDYWRLLIGEEPQPSQQDEFDALWRGLTTGHGYRVERMLQDLIQTEAYGAP